MNRNRFVVAIGLMAAMVILFGWFLPGWSQTPAQQSRQTGVPDYYNTPNWANSPQLRKFVDTLPPLCGAAGSATNNLGQCIPVAIPDKTTYPGSDYYEIEIVEYREQMHSDLPAVVGTNKMTATAGGTKLRGYRQTNTSNANLLTPHYLGPVIVATKGTPVRILFNQVITIDFGIGVALVFTGKQVSPLDLTLPDLLAKHAILFAGPGHHADETAPPAGEAAEVFFRGQLAVCHINEIGSLEQPAQALMVFRVEAIIGLIARIHLVHQRHRTVGRHRQPQDQLLEVWTMILIDAVGQLLRHLPRVVLAAEGYRGGVLMNLDALEPKGFDGSEGQVEEDVRAVSGPEHQA